MHNGRSRTLSGHQRLPTSLVSRSPPKVYTHLALHLASNMGISEARPTRTSNRSDLGGLPYRLSVRSWRFTAGLLRSDCVAYILLLSL